MPVQSVRPRPCPWCARWGRTPGRHVRRGAANEGHGKGANCGEHEASASRGPAQLTRRNSPGPSSRFLREAGAHAPSPSLRQSSSRGATSAPSRPRDTGFKETFTSLVLQPPPPLLCPVGHCPQRAGREPRSDKSELSTASAALPRPPRAPGGPLGSRLRLREQTHAAAGEGGGVAEDGHALAYSWLLIGCPSLAGDKWGDLRLRLQRRCQSSPCSFSHASPPPPAPRNLRELRRKHVSGTTRSAGECSGAGSGLGTVPQAEP